MPKPLGGFSGLLAALACGALLPLALAPFNWWPLGLVSIGGWFWLLNRRAASAWALGFAYGFGKFGVGVSWVYVSIHDYGNASPPLAALLVLMFVAGLSLFSLAQARLYAWLRIERHSDAGSGPSALGERAVHPWDAQREAQRRCPPSEGGTPLSREARSTGKAFRASEMPMRTTGSGGSAPVANGSRFPNGAAALSNAWLFAAVWVAFEWVLTWFLTGFPWLYPGYGHLRTPLANLLPVGGVSLASLGIVVTASCLVSALFDRQSAAIRAMSGAVAATPWLIGLALSGTQWVEPRATRSAALVQGNVDQAVKWDRDNRMPVINRYRELTEPHWGRDLILWPEAAITLLEHEAAPWLQRWDERGQASGTSLVLGIPSTERTADGDHRFQNAAMAIGRGDGRYVKRRLVPFGDYVPLENALRGLIEFFDLPMSRAAPGPWRQPPLALGEDRAAMAICYEIAYANLTRNAANQADLILAITNDTWFGRSIGPLQHLQIAQARALENGRWLLRAANNGITAVIDHRGQVRARLPQFERGVLLGDFRIMAGRTPYGRFGDGWLVAICLGSLLAFAWNVHMKR